MTSVQIRSVACNERHDCKVAPAETAVGPASSLAEATQTRSATSRLAWLIPRQHGAWSILFASYTIGTLAFEGKDGGVPWIVLGAVIAGFVAQHATLAALQRSASPSQRRWAAIWAGVLGTIAACLVSVLVVSYELHALLPVFGVGGVLAVASLLVHYRHRDRTAWGELLGILGLSAVIPLASVSRTEVFYRDHLVLWLLGTLFFSGSVFHVRYVVRKWRKRRRPLLERLQAGWGSLVYHAAALTAVVTLSRLGLAPSWAPATFLPVTIKAFWAMRRGVDAPPVIRSVGLSELAHTVLFSALIVITYRLSK